MKKRLAKKALSGSYFDVWMKPGVNKKLLLPRNGRCWFIIQKACYYYKHPEWIEEISTSILDTIGE